MTERTALTIAPSNTAIAPTSAPMALNPRSLEEAMRLSDYLAKSSIIPKAFRGHPADVFVAIEFGAELGIPPMASLRNVHVIEGRPSLSAQAAHGVCMNQPDCRAFARDHARSKRGEREVWVCVRGDQSFEGEFSIEDAKRAGLLGKDNWRGYPDAMLENRAIMRAARRAYPDRLGGIHSLDELQDGAIEMTESAPDRFAPPPAPEPSPAARAAFVATFVHPGAEPDPVPKSVQPPTVETMFASTSHPMEPPEQVPPEPEPIDVGPADIPIAGDIGGALNEEQLAAAARLEAEFLRLRSSIAAASTEVELEQLADPCRKVKGVDVDRGNQLLREYLDRRTEIRRAAGMYK